MPTPTPELAPTVADVNKALMVSDDIDGGACLDYCGDGVFAHDTFRQLARWYVRANAPIGSRDHA